MFADPSSASVMLARSIHLASGLARRSRGSATLLVLEDNQNLVCLRVACLLIRHLVGKGIAQTKGGKKTRKLRPKSRRQEIDANGCQEVEIEESSFPIYRDNKQLRVTR